MLVKTEAGKYSQLVMFILNMCMCMKVKPTELTK